VLNAMGRLEARYLVAGVEVYDPSQSLNRAKRAGATPWDGLVERLDQIGAEPTSGPKR